MSLLSILRRTFNVVRHRRDVRSLVHLDDHTLADIGLLRTDVHAALAGPFFADPSRALKAACCHWRSFIGRPVAIGPVGCC